MVEKSWEEYLPVLYVFMIFHVHCGLLLAVYVLPGLQVDVTLPHLNIRKMLISGLPCSRYTAFGWSLAACACVALFFRSFWEVYTTPPGRIPPTKEWVTQPNLERIHERSADGDLRICKHEGIYKPDRAHYCHNIATNVLKLDHYCPWVLNAVGFYNYKAFVLTLAYATLSLVLVVGNGRVAHQSGLLLSRILEISAQEPACRALTILAVVQSLFLLSIIGGFLGFHVYLISRNLTTIGERVPVISSECMKGGASRYDRGFIGNWAAVFGPHPSRWLIPTFSAVGDGLHFAVGSETLKSGRSQSSRA